MPARNDDKIAILETKLTALLGDADRETHNCTTLFGQAVSLDESDYEAYAEAFEALAARAKLVATKYREAAATRDEVLNLASE